MSIIDQSARQSALDTAHSCCVSAPAGSGKTELLTQRILTILGQCEHPENVLAITFTRKAAGEMRKRLLDTLQKADEVEDLSEFPAHERQTLALAQRALAQDDAQGWGLLKNPGRLQITTIDSFNHRLATRLPLLSGFGGAPAISQDPRPLYEEAVLALFSRLENDDALAEDLALVIPHMGNDLPRLQQLLVSLLSRRDQWLSHVLPYRHPAQEAAMRAHQEVALQALIRDTLMAGSASLSPWLDDLLDSLRFARQTLQQQNPAALLASEDCAALETITSLEADIDQLPLWRALSSLLLTQSGSVRKSVTVRDGFPRVEGNAAEKQRRSDAKARIQSVLEALADCPEAVQLLQQVQALPDATVSDSEWPVLRALTGVLTHLAGELSVVFQRHHQCDYTEVGIRALEALGAEEQPTALALRLDYAIQHILVDEFQDTSQLQIDLLSRLMRGWSEGDGRTLFIVGDGMQSCYGFRDANVGLFLSARRYGIGHTPLQPLDLQVNFRSTPEVVEWVNQVFRQAFPARDDPGRGAVSYTASSAFNDSGRDSGVETILFTMDEETDTSDGEKAEAEQVASIVESLQQESPLEDIAILVKNRHHLRCILPALKARGITWNATEIDSLGAYPDIRDLMTLTRALLNPADTTAWLGLLRCPFVGLAMSDIVRLVRQCHADNSLLRDRLLTPPSSLDLSDTGRTLLTRLQPVLMAAPHWRLELPLRDWIERCWYHLGGPACLGQETDSTHIEAFFSLLEDTEDNGDILSVNRLQEKLASHHVDSRPGERTGLQIMTIHKAKGLEFDHVILPRLNSGSRNDDPALLQWHQYVDEDGQDHLLLSIPESRGQQENRLHAWIGSEKKLRRRLEDTRVLYIGITRAVRKAWLVASVTTKDDEPKPVKGSLLGTIWDAMQQTGVPVRYQAVSPSAAPAERTDSHEQTGVLPLKRLSADWSAPDIEDSLPAETTPLPVLGFNRAERLRGDIIHEVLMQVVEGQLTLQDSTALQQRLPAWRQRFSTCSEDPESEVTRVLDQLHALARSDTAAWLLDPGHSESACELALSDFRGRWRREAVIDRTFIDGGIRWIIDYKSSSPAAGQTMAAFLASEGSRYQKQLSWYATLMQHMSPDKPVRTALYFTALDHLEELPLQSG